MIALVGQTGAGKGEVAKILQSKGFRYFSTSDMLRRHLKEAGYENYTFVELQKFAREYRERHHPGIFAEELISEIDPADGDFILDGVRAIGEIETARKTANFCRVLAVIASPEVRYHRVLARKRAEGEFTWESFLQHDAEQFGTIDNPYGQQEGLCIELADYRLENESNSLEKLASDLEKILARYEEEKKLALKK